MTDTAIVHRAAVIVDRCYRYQLDRWWDDGPLMGFAMLNPSTADADIDDPTVTRCMGFARREGYAGIRVVNLFAFRATDPEALRREFARVGPDNDNTIDRLFDDVLAGRVSVLVAAWGAHLMARDRAAIVRQRAAHRGVTLHCLGKTSDGSPRHPLYVPADQPLEVWP